MFGWTMGSCFGVRVETKYIKQLLFGILTHTLKKNKTFLVCPTGLHKVCLDLGEHMWLKFATWHALTYLTVFHQQPWKPLVRWGHREPIMLTRNVIYIDGCIPFTGWLFPLTRWQWSWMPRVGINWPLFVIVGWLVGWLVTYLSYVVSL